MIKTILRVLGVAALVFAFSSVAHADGLTLQNAGNNVMGGVYVGPYNFTGTVSGQSGSLQLICDDFADEVHGGESWNVTTSTLPSLSSVQFTGSTQYEEVAWLAQKMFQNLGDAQTVGDIQWAIWDVFDPGASSTDPYGKLSGTDQQNVANWLGWADSQYGNGDYSNIMFYTPIVGTQPSGDGRPQEYVGLTPTPEPGAFLLVGLGLPLALLFGRRLAL
ncbi:MAG: PEP-CTERM sorting domain-containing protein [Candidatus Acidiferrales bacterium]